MKQLTRRMMMKGLAAGSALWTTPGLFAEQLVPTRVSKEGPFYPDRLPLDTDNDLLIINDSITPAVGEITHLSGQILSATGKPVLSAYVEIWQCDARGAYIHTRSAEEAGNADGNFQGYGRFVTGSTGQYYFRTIKPVPYASRAPHIHFAISMNGRRILVTQAMIKGHPLNPQDRTFTSGRDEHLLKTVMVDWKKVADSGRVEWNADFDIVLGRTLDELKEEPLRGGIGPSERQGQRSESGRRGARRRSRG
jgi:protocatechuate 3,4-dioxygenase, beta subunit